MPFKEGIGVLYKVAALIGVAVVWIALTLLAMWGLRVALR